MTDDNDDDSDYDGGDDDDDDVCCGHFPVWVSTSLSSLSTGIWSNKKRIINLVHHSLSVI